MAKLLEVIDSLNNENAEELRETLRAEALAQEENNRKLYSRAKTAEGFTYHKDTKEWKKEEKKVEPEKKELEKSSEPDYARLAFLEQRGLNHPDDQKLVQDEATRLKMPLTDILGMAHIKAKLQESKDQRDAEAGMPKGRGKGSGKSQQDVDYWLAKQVKADGTFETPTDPSLAEKVIEARYNQKKQGEKFDNNELYTG